MGDRTDWKAVWIGVGITLVAGCAVIIWPSQFVAWAGLLIGAIVTGVALGWHIGGIYVRVLGATVSFGAVAALYFLTPHPPIFENAAPPGASAPPISQALPPNALPLHPPANLLLDLFMTENNHFTGAVTSPTAAEVTLGGAKMSDVFFRVNYDSDSRSKFIMLYILNTTDFEKAIPELSPLICNTLTTISY